MLPESSTTTTTSGRSVRYRSRIQPYIMVSSSAIERDADGRQRQARAATNGPGFPQVDGHHVGGGDQQEQQRDPRRPGPGVRERHFDSLAGYGEGSPNRPFNRL